MSKHTQHKISLKIPFIIILLMVLTVVSGCAAAPLASETVQATAAKVARVQETVSSATETEPERQSQPAPTIVQSPDQEVLADLYDRIVPSVVNIQVTGVSPLGMGELPEEFPFEFPDSPGFPDMPAMGEGSGWVYDDQGHIITNNHVVEGAEEVIIIFHNGLWTEAEVVATDPQSDLAVLKVDAPEGVELIPFPLAEPDSMRVGYSVIAIGNPFGLESTMTTGIISALGRSFPVGNALTGNFTLPAVIQTDAAINPGNSGGPLLNLDGEVVGVNFAIESPIQASSGVGFAIPVSIIQRVIPALIDSGEYDYPYIGIAGQSVTPQLAKMLELPENVLGAYVDDVVPDGPADKAGVHGGKQTIQVDGVDMRLGGDILVAIDDEPVRSFEDLVSYLVRKTEPGQQATLTVMRDGELLDLDIELGERPIMEIDLAEEQSMDGIGASAAIAIARDTVSQEDLLDGPVIETVVTQGESDGQPIWTVELSDASATATVVIDAVTGDVLDVSVK